MYSAFTYFISKILVELPFQILFPLGMIGMLYGPLGLAGRFWVLALFMIALNNVGQVTTKVGVHVIAVQIPCPPEPGQRSVLRVFRPSGWSLDAPSNPRRSRCKVRTTDRPCH